MHFNDDDSELIHDLEYVTTLLMAPEIRREIADAGDDVTEVVVLDDMGPGVGDYIVERNRRIDQAIEALQKIFGN